MRILTIAKGKAWVWGHTALRIYSVMLLSDGVVFTQTELAEMLGIRRQTVAAVWKKLETAGLIANGVALPSDVIRTNVNRQSGEPFPAYWNCPLPNEANTLKAVASDLFWLLRSYQYATINGMAKQLGCGKATIRRALGELNTAGLVNGVVLTGYCPDWWQPEEEKVVLPPRAEPAPKPAPRKPEPHRVNETPLDYETIVADLYKSAFPGLAANLKIVTREAERANIPAEHFQRMIIDLPISTEYELNRVLLRAETELQKQRQTEGIKSPLGFLRVNLEKYCYRMGKEDMPPL